MGSLSSNKIKDEVRQLYIDWCKIPIEVRRAEHARDKSYPSTMGQFAKLHHVNRSTLYRWEQEPEFKREVANEALGLLTLDETMKMIQVMKSKALDGSVPAFNALMKIAGLNAENSALFADVEKEKAEVAQMSDAELEKYLEGLDDDEDDSS